MSNYNLTKGTESFIRNQSNRSLLTGKEKYALPYSTNSTNSSITYTSILNESLTDAEFCEKIITWLNLYSNQFQVNANILAAQMFAESRYYAWAYSSTGAIGISQFTAATIFSRIIRSSNFTSIEKGLITKDLTGVDEVLVTSKANRVQLHQNVIDNPELMIKAQASLMNFISGRNNNIASSALFAYNRGSSYTSTNYSGLVSKCKTNKGAEYCVEGLNYVEKIFGLLTNEFNIDLDNSKDLAMTEYGAGAYTG